MHKKLVNLVKYNRFFLAAYGFCGNLMVALLKLFTKINDKRILFMSFGGQKYDDSPRALYEAIKDDPFFAEYDLVWCFTRPDSYGDIGCRKVKTDTLAFYLTALTSRVWVNNSSVTRGLKLKRRGIVEINTWHGAPLKKIGSDAHGSFGAKMIPYDENTYFCAQSDFDGEIFSRLFGVRRENMIIRDLPRNDALLRYTDGQIEDIRKQLGLPEGKKVILYAPTFREYDRTGVGACYIAPPIDIKKWEKELGDKYVMLLRAHYEVANVMGVGDSGFVVNVSDYPRLNDLMAVSDMLISDYSSVYFDYSITEKPMFNFSYDLETYKEKRGLYLDLQETLPCLVNFTEDGLIEEILSHDTEAYREGSRRFKERFCPHAGEATAAVVAVIKKRLSA